MISDALFDALSQIRRYQTEMPDQYQRIASKIDQLRAHINLVMMELDTADPIMLIGNPIYEACKKGDITLSDRYMDGDESVLEEWRKRSFGLLSDE